VNCLVSIVFTFCFSLSPSFRESLPVLCRFNSDSLYTAESFPLLFSLLFLISAPRLDDNDETSSFSALRRRLRLFVMLLRSRALNGKPAMLFVFLFSWTLHRPVAFSSPLVFLPPGAGRSYPCGCRCRWLRSFIVFSTRRSISSLLFPPFFLLVSFKPRSVGVDTQARRTTPFHFNKG